MRMAFVSISDPNSLNSFSGTTWHMAEAFRAAGVDVVSIGPLRRPGRLPLKVFEKIHDAVSHSRYQSDREPYLVRSYARQIRKALKAAGPVDFILSPGSLPVSLLDVDVPVVIWADATVGVMLDYYEEFSHWSPRTKRNARRMEAQALSRSTLFVAASEWARKGAIREYGVSPGKTAVVPFGANLVAEAVPNVTPAERASTPEKRFLLVGVNWSRKGVNTAIEAVGLVREAGIDAKLDVVGCEPPEGLHVPEYVTVHGFVDKGSPEGSGRMKQLFEQASVFILPSTAECLGIVLCEASAHGLPCLVAKTGGMGQVIADKVHGALIEPPTSAPQYAAAALDILTNEDRYIEQARAARRAYEDRLNWPIAVEHVLAALKPLLPSRVRSR